METAEPTPPKRVIAINVKMRSGAFRRMTRGRLSIRSLSYAGIEGFIVERKAFSEDDGVAIATDDCSDFRDFFLCQEMNAKTSNMTPKPAKFQRCFFDEAAVDPMTARKIAIPKRYIASSF
jgi:hypothetical protein